MDEVVSLVNSKVTEGMNLVLCAPYNEQEIFEALKVMHPCKAPSPNGFNPLFVSTILGFHRRRCLEGCTVRVEWWWDAPLNYTNVVLIPEISNPSSLEKFRPISLCNVIYKLITKVDYYSFKDYTSP